MARDLHLPGPARLAGEESLYFVGHPGTVDDGGAKRNGFVEGQRAKCRDGPCGAHGEASLFLSSALDRGAPGTWRV